MAEHSKKGASPLSQAAAKLGAKGGKDRLTKMSQQARTAVARQGGIAKNKGTAHQRGQTGTPPKKK